MHRVAPGIVSKVIVLKVEKAAAKFCECRRSASFASIIILQRRAGGYLSCYFVHKLAPASFVLLRLFTTALVQQSNTNSITRAKQVGLALLLHKHFALCEVCAGI